MKAATNQKLRPLHKGRTHTPRILTQVRDKQRSYWSGLEAEEIIQRVAEGEAIAEESERLDVMVDPETAQIWLRRNKLNRSISNTTVCRYADDMIADNWPYTHQGIAFDRQGWMIDGQHRLHAIIRSGKTIPMQVTVNMPAEIKRAIDQGKSRTTADVATLEARTQVEAKMSATATKMHNSVYRTSVKGTRTEQVDFILKHLPAILFAVEELPDRYRVSYAATRAVIARASYTVEREVLKRFCRILRDGGYGARESVAFMVREYIIRTRSRSTADALSVYCKTEWALQKFIERFEPKRLDGTDRELFLLPEEELAETKKAKKKEA